MSILEPSQIMVRAAAVLQALRQSDVWKASLESGTLTSVPLLVTSIAPEERSRPRMGDYFIVSIRRPGGTSARFAHDAETGAFLEAEGVRVAGVHLSDYVDPEEALLQRIRSDGSPGLAGERLPSPEVVWRPCRESTSRFLPFWRFHIQGRTTYVRADGAIFEALSTTGRG